MWKLVIEDDEGKRTVVPLTRDDYTIGRKEGNTIRLTERNVSREHAKLRRKKVNGAGAAAPVQYALEDCTSYNGVYVNGLRVANAQELVHGDLIQIGDYRMVLQDDQVIEAPTAVPSISADSKATIPSAMMNRGVTLMERPNRLVMLAGPTPGAEYALDRDRLTVGRAEDATISINHNSVSRLHCEIHLLGEGRYEIVDKGSSNGVRVNSAELKRGIIEAGDIIELGDVKFKFVGAGQIFLPGVNDSQQLATIGDRAVPPPRPRRSGIWPYVILGMAVAGVLVLAWAWMQSRMQNQTVPTPTITSESPLTKDQALVEQAKLLADKGDLEGAHAKLAECTTDTIQSGPDYQSIEARWAKDLLDRADREPDLNLRRDMARRVEGNRTTDVALRKRAQTILQSIEDAQRMAAAPTMSTTPAATRDAAPAPTTATAIAQREPAPQPTRRATPPPPPAQPDPTPPPAPTKPARAPIDAAREALLNGHPEIAKGLLMPIVASGKGTPDEVRALKAACDGLKDRACQDFVRGR
jgi:pSer/pThr/pTyr-binding forkhead associated (FHA) protein